MARPQTLTVKKLIAITPDLAREIADFRFERRIDTEAEAIRRLIELGLKASAEAPKETAG